MSLQLILDKMLFIDTIDHLHVEYNGLSPLDLDDAGVSLLSDYIVSRLVETNQTFLLFNLAGEGLPLNPLLFTTAIVRCLMLTHHLPKHIFSIDSGAAPSLYNISLYDRHCITHNLELIKIRFWNSYENSASQVQLHRNKRIPDPYYDKFDTTPRIKQKLFLSYNRNSSRIHRLYLTAEVIRRNLLDRAFFSMYLGGVTLEESPNISGELDYHWKNIHHFIPNSCDRIRQTLDDNIDLFPLRLNLYVDSQPFHIDDDLHYYNNSYFSVVTETKFFADVAGIYDTQLDCILFSEKTYKPILGKHPFIFMGFPGSLRVLRESGYRTFHPYIDETYDTIINDESRLESILDEIERLSNFTDDQWLEWQTSVKSIVEHNFEVLKNHRQTCLTR